MNTAKIVFIGVGSMSFGVRMFQDLFCSRELEGSELALVDLNPETLGVMADLAVLMNKASGSGMKITRTTDRREALDGAGFVVNSAAIERNKYWKLDFEIPRRHGIRQTLGENGGPGGLFFTLRTLPMIFDIVRDMEALCPDALFVNFSNPESRIVLALGRYSRIRTVGLCHGVFMGRHDAAKIMGLADQDVDVFGAGLNHFQWLLELRDRATGADLYPRLRERERGFDPAFMPLSRRLFRAFGKYPSCSDDHLGEYVAYGWEGGDHGYDFTRDERERAETRADILARNSGAWPVKDLLVPSGERGADVITSVLHNRKRVLESGVVMNRGAIANLPGDLAVEVPVAVDAAGVHPLSVGALPDGIAKLLLMQASVQQLSVEAAAKGSKELALQALLIDPVVTSTEAALKILEELWEVNRPFIRAFA
jgi:alpha-galactosidase